MGKEMSISVEGTKTFEKNVGIADSFLTSFPTVTMILPKWSRYHFVAYRMITSRSDTNKISQGYSYFVYRR